jgi:hypothetical protein
MPTMPDRYVLTIESPRHGASLTRERETYPGTPDGAAAARDRLLSLAATMSDVTLTLRETTGEWGLTLATVTINHLPTVES